MRTLALTLLSLFTVSTFAQITAYTPGPILTQRLPPNITLGACSAVAVDRDHNIILLHRGNPAVLVFDRGGQFKRAWGDNLFKLAHGLRIDADGDYWITDLDQHVLQKFSPDGKLLQTLGEPGKSGEDESHFNRPADIAFGGAGHIYVADGYGNSRVVVYDKDGKFFTAFGKKGTGPGEFNLPHAVRLDSRGNVYVADRENNRIQVFNQSHKFQKIIDRANPPKTADGKPSEPVLFSPYGLALLDDDTMIIADGRANRVLVMKTDGRLVTQFGAHGNGPGQFDLPHGITYSLRTNSLFVTEINNKRLQRFDPVHAPRR